MKHDIPDPVNTAERGGYLSILSAWALAFGCAVGWGAFIMPGTTFLPMAGPLGTVLGIALGALVMGIIALNYHYLMQRHPDAGGAYACVKELCNHDHAFLCGWFLLLTYAAIVWANATALALVERTLFRGVFRFGFHYGFAGWEVWGGELLLSAAMLAAGGALLAHAKRWAARVQTVLACVLAGSSALALAAALWKSGGGFRTLAPAFAPGGGGGLVQMLGIVALAPWAYVGFESVSHSAEGFRFPRRRAIWVMAAALAAAAFAYAAFAAVAASAAARPEGIADWPAHVGALGDLPGIESMPVFNAVENALGRPGAWFLGVATLSAVFTGVLGMLTAASRLLVAMARDGMFPAPLAALTRSESPARAVWALVAVSCLVPFAGRTAISWIVDVTTVGASVAYGYVSLCTCLSARRTRSRLYEATGLAGLVASVAFAAFCLVPDLLAVGTFSTESYLILAVWSVLGALRFRRLLVHDATGRLGKSTVVWLALLFLVFFTTHIWVRQATYRVADGVVTEVGAHYAGGESREAPAPDDPYLRGKEAIIGDALTRYHLAQMVIVVLALGVMVGIYAAISRRERDAAKAKDYFFSTISHDIRTPINAIVGYTETLRLAPAGDAADRGEALSAILSSSRTLLRIVDDILELSRLESGNAVIEPEPTDCAALVRNVLRAFEDPARKAGLDLRTTVDPMPRLLVDALRMRQIVFHLVGNAIKFTEKGHVEIRVAYTPVIDTHVGDLRIEVEDTGVGIAAEDLPRITTAYVQLGAKLARNGGTGLGLAVCRQLATAMGGTFSVRSTVGKGTTFTVLLPRLKTADEDAPAPAAPAASPATAGNPPAPPDWLPPPEDFTDAPFPPSPSPTTATPAPSATTATPPPSPAPTAPAPAAPALAAAAAPADPAHSLPRILLVDDSKMNLMVLKALLKRLGSYDLALASDGNEALEMLRHAGDRPFSLVLTDYWMPNLDGGGLVGAIRADPHLASIPVHVITADIELQAEYVSKGFDSLLLKPVTPDSLRPLLPAS